MVNDLISFYNVVSKTDTTDSLRGFDYTGKEVFWIITNGHVNALALIDVNKDGKNEVYK